MVEDYSHTGLSLREHPVAFLREDLWRRRIVTCKDAMDTRYAGRKPPASSSSASARVPPRASCSSPSRTRPASPTSSSGPKVFEQHRRIVLSAGMIAVTGRLQREGEVVHLVAHRITDLSRELASIGDSRATFPLLHGRGNEVRSSSALVDPRTQSKGLRTRDTYIPDAHLDAIRVKTRDFR